MLPHITLCLKFKGTINYGNMVISRQGIYILNLKYN